MTSSVSRVERIARPGETVLSRRADSFFGGKGANQAVAAARLGASVTMVGAVGDDDLGGAAVRALRDEGIDITQIAVVDQPTGVALIVVDEAGENQIAVASGANAELGTAHVTSGLGDVLARADASPGVVLLGHEVSPEVVTAAALAAGEAGWPVVLNPAPARDLPDAEIHLLDAGHYALETSGEEIAGLVRDFLGRIA